MLLELCDGLNLPSLLADKQHLNVEAVHDLAYGIFSGLQVYNVASVALPQYKPVCNRLVQCFKY